MTHYLLDTNHASPLVTVAHPLRERVLPAIETGDSFALTAVNLTELLFGISMTPRAAHNTRQWEQWRASLNVYRVEDKDAMRAARLQSSLRRRGWQLETVDALIAAIALRYDLTLLTTDGDFDAVPDLKHENWLLLRNPR
jgi:predicted nucleic acid-binding protein